MSEPNWSVFQNDDPTVSKTVYAEAERQVNKDGSPGNNYLCQMLVQGNTRVI